MCYMLTRLLSLFLLWLALDVPAVGARTAVLHPVDGSVVDELGGQIVGFCDDPGAAEVTLTLNGKPHRVELWDGVFATDLDWAEGANELRIDKQTLRFTADPYAETVKQPTVHQAMLDNCANCHVLGAERSLALGGAPDALCRGCHGAVAAAVAHGTTPCGYCHVPHTSWTPALLVRTGNGLCLGCHGERTGGAGIAHQALWGELACSTCHDAHRPGVAAGVGERCGACHGGKAAALPDHQAAVDTGCQLCHTMHGSAGKGLWKTPELACRGCHPAGADPRHDPLTAACGDCHGLHAPRELPPSGERCRSCHGALMDKQRVHGPEALGRCETCHPLHQLTNLSPAVFSCTGCHGMEKLQTGHTGSVLGFHTCRQCHHLHQSNEPLFLAAVQHTPFRERSCEQCHEFSGFDRQRKLAGPWGELCAQCHDDPAGAGAAHGPVAEGRCQACHASHGSPWPAQLKQEQRPLCRSCHPLGEASAGQAQAPHLDKRLCSDCHTPHGNSEASYLLAAGAALCSRCHADPTLDLGGVLKPYVHGPLNTVVCRFCHDPHAGPGGRHLRMPAAVLCISCHDEFAPAAVAGSGDAIHRPVSEGNCAACHLPHAARNKALLRAEGNRLCTACHPPSKHSHTLIPRAASSFAQVPAEWPRDGDVLLCQSCHLPHSGPQKGLLVRSRSELCASCHKGN